MSAVSLRTQQVDDRVGDAEDEQARRRGVAGVMETGVPDACRLQELLPLVVVRVRVQGLAGGRGEYVPLLRPQVTRAGPFAGLVLAVRRRSWSSSSGTPYRALAGSGLRALRLPAGC